MGQASASARNHVHVARQIQLAHPYLLHPAVIDLPCHAHARDDGNAHAHLHETLDAFNRRHFNGHVERGFVAAKKFNDPATKGRFDAVRDKTFAAEVGNVHFLSSSQHVLRMNDERQFVLEDFRGLQLGVARNEGNSSEIEAVVEHFMWNVTREHAMYADLHAWMGRAELRKCGQKSMNRAFVHAERKFAAREAFQFGQALFHFVTQVDETLGVVAQQVAGVSQANRSRAAYKERLAQASFQFANGQAYRRLRTVQPLRGARKAAFSGDG